MSLFPLTNSEIPFFWYGFKHKFVNLEHTVLRALSRLLVSAILFYPSSGPFAWKAPCGLLCGQGQLSRILKVQCDWLSMGKNVVFGWAGVCGKGSNTSPPKNACGGGYHLWEPFEGFSMRGGGEGTWKWVLEVWVSRVVWSHPPSENYEI